MVGRQGYGLKVVQVSFVEAVKKVEEDGSWVRDPERTPVSSRSVTAQRDRPVIFVLWRNDQAGDGSTVSFV